MITSLFFLAILLVVVPIGICLCLAGVVFILDSGSTVLFQSFPLQMFAVVDSYGLIAIPLFILIGEIMNSGGITRRLVELAMAFIGSVKGGLAYVNILANMMVASIIGSATAQVAIMSQVMVPEMEKQGYDKTFAAGITVYGGMLGPIIPPSVMFVVYSVLAQVAVSDMLIAGIIPGILCGLAQMIVSYFLAKKEGVPKAPGHFTIGPVLHGLWESWPALLMPIIIVGTITMGIVSPTEAGVIAVVYGLFAGGIIYRELKWEDIKFAFAETVRTSGRIFIVIGAAKLYTVMLTTAGFDKWVAKTMLGFSTNPTVILIVILLIFFIVTMFMESIATLTLFMPILYPIALGVGINPIVLSVLITVVIGVGLVTPPVGMCIYVACDLMDVTVGEVFPTLVPFIAATFVCIALMVAFPQLILLPTYLMA